MNWFKNKKHDTDNPWGSKNSQWWEECKRLFKKDFPNGVIDHNDPEYDSQKIYQHWIKSYLAK